LEQRNLNTKIIYLIGAGRSGTTLLDIIIGNNDNITSCGELNRYLNRGGLPPKCETTSDCYVFWKKIKERLNYTDDQLKNLDKVSKVFEYHKGFFKKLIGISTTKNLAQYKQFHTQLFEAILAETPNTILVDSSKYPGRASMLSEILPYEISYVYIKRNPVSVVRSFAKRDVAQPSKNWLAANLYYFTVNILCTLAVYQLKKRHKTTTITYEELVNNPISTLSQIESDLELNFSQVIDKAKKGDMLRVGNLIEGNRIRLKKEIRITATEKVEPLNFLEQIVHLIQFPLYRSR
jgi:hypothetical protein